jgi:hypothetical protein
MIMLFLNFNQTHSLLPKKLFWALLVFFLGAQFCVAQSNAGDEKIEAAKIAMLTTRLNLNSEQAKTFWPLYNMYTDRKKEIRATDRKLRATMEAKINEDNNDQELEIKQLLNRINDNRQESLNTDRAFIEKFQKVISYKQTGILFAIEREFAKMLLRRLDENAEASKRGVK